MLLSSIEFPVKWAVAILKIWSRYRFSLLQGGFINRRTKLLCLFLLCHVTLELHLLKQYQTMQLLVLHYSKMGSPIGCTGFPKLLCLWVVPLLIKEIIYWKLWQMLEIFASHMDSEWTHANLCKRTPDEFPISSRRITV